MKKILLNISTFLLFISCAKDLQKEGVDFATAPPNIDYKKELQSYFKANLKVINNDFTAKNFPLDTLYKELNHQLVWISDSLTLNHNAEGLLDSLSGARKYGLNTAYYHVNSIRRLKRELLDEVDEKKKYKIASEIELKLSDAYMFFGKHLHYGALDSISGITELPRKRLTVNFIDYFKNAAVSKSMLPNLFDLQPKSDAYKKIQVKLVDHLNNGSMSTDFVTVMNFRKDSIRALVQAQKALVLHKYLDSVTSDSIFNIALQKFQRDHGLKPDGLVGSNTAKALSKSPYRYYQTLVANLERWRWKDPLPEDYLLANIAAYNVKMFVQGTVAHQYNTVVGKFKTQTPEIKDSLLSVIAYPYWYVPKKISLEEVFVKAQKDSTYFARNNFEVITYKKEPVPYSSLNWEEINNGSFNYLVRQAGGWSNSLGLVKFIFPNKNAIYLHDSPSKSLFNRETRAYSHGCVRVQHALKLADNLLAYDKNNMTIDTVQKYISIKKQKVIRLKKRLPVLLYYFTADVNKDGDVILYDDIYDKDRLIIAQLRQIDKKYQANNN